jgi:hypothetical protein
MCMYAVQAKESRSCVACCLQHSNERVISRLTVVGYPSNPHAKPGIPLLVPARITFYGSAHINRPSTLLTCWIDRDKERCKQMWFLFSPGYANALTLRSSLVRMSVRPFPLRNANALRSKAETLPVPGVNGAKDDPRVVVAARSHNDLDQERSIRSLQPLFFGFSALRKVRKIRDFVAKTASELYSPFSQRC